MTFESQQQARKTSIELLRIIAIVGIIFCHLVYFGVMRVGKPDAFIQWQDAEPFNQWVASASMLGQIGVGIFFMISGYFNAENRKIRIKKICAISLFYAMLGALSSVLMYVCVGGYRLLVCLV